MEKEVLQFAKYFEGSECAKCGGKGKIGCFSHVHDGQCYQCNGVGKFLTSKGKKSFNKFCNSLKLKAFDVAVGDFLLDGKFRFYVTSIEVDGSRVSISSKQKVRTLDANQDLFKVPTEKVARPLLLAALKYQKSL